MRRAIFAMGLLITVALAGCADTGAVETIAARAETVSASLAQVKSSAQLLRNEAAGRLPHIVFEEVIDSTDVSVPCLSDQIDPRGLARSWTSSTTILVVNSQAARISTVADTMVASFVDQGWTADVAGADTTLSKPDSTSVIGISVIEKAQGTQPAIHVSVTSPCVMTGGADSDEIKKLENRGDE